MPNTGNGHDHEAVAEAKSLAVAINLPFDLATTTTMTASGPDDGTDGGDEMGEENWGEKSERSSPHLQAAIAYVRGQLDTDIRANRQRLDRMDGDMIRLRQNLETFVGEAETRIYKEIAWVRQEFLDMRKEVSSLRERVVKLMAWATVAGAALAMAGETILRIWVK